MKVGDLIRYTSYFDKSTHIGIALKLDWLDDEVVVLWQDGEVEEVETQYCEVISESR